MTGNVLSFQVRSWNWLMHCFGKKIAVSKRQRNHRFLEEALELVQSCDCTEDEAIAAVRYVFARPKGEKGSEVGGVMNTLSVLCTVHGLDLCEEAERELAKNWINSDKIKEKHALKPAFTAVFPDIHGSDTVTSRCEG